MFVFLIKASKSSAISPRFAIRFGNYKVDAVRKSFQNCCKFISSHNSVGSDMTEQDQRVVYEFGPFRLDAFEILRSSWSSGTSPSIALRSGAGSRDTHRNCTAGADRNCG